MKFHKIAVFVFSIPILAACTQNEFVVKTRAITVDGKSYFVRERHEVNSETGYDEVRSQSVTVLGRSYDCSFRSCDNVVREVLAEANARRAEQEAKSAQMSAAASAAAQARKARREAEEKPKHDTRGD